MSEGTKVTDEYDSGTSIEEIEHPGWRSFEKETGIKDPFFENLLFLQGFEFSSNIYALKGDYITLIDVGNDYTAFMDLRRHGVDLSEIRKIVITHGHRDHAMGIFELIRAYPTLTSASSLEFILHQEGPQELKDLLNDAGCHLTEVVGGETLDLSGYPFEVVYSPGHTLDGICLFHAASKTCFTGDVVLPEGLAEVDNNGGGRPEHYVIGFRSLLARDIENVMPGHGPPIVSIGRNFIENSYVMAMMKIIEVENPIPWIEGARALVTKGYLEEAIFCCSKELVRNPENIMAMQLRALCCNDLGRFEEALDAFDQLVELHPVALQDPFTHIGKGYALMGLARYQESISFFDEASRLRPDLKDPLIYKGMALYLSGNYDEAMNIEAFSREFTHRFKDHLQRKQSSPPNSG